METGFALSEIDTTTPHPARIYDALLGGKDNYAAARQTVRQLLKAAPEARDSARANRAFLQRAVRFLACEAGIRQIIDIGTGIPAAGNVHEVAEARQVDSGLPAKLLVVEHELNREWAGALDEHLEGDREPRAATCRDGIVRDFAPS